MTVRWAILACGTDFMLSGSAGVHGTDACGLPSTPMHIYVDRYDFNVMTRILCLIIFNSDVDPTFTYDPSEIPFNKDTGHRRRYAAHLTIIYLRLNASALVSKTLYNLIVTTHWMYTRTACTPSTPIFSPAPSAQSLSTTRPSPSKKP